MSERAAMITQVRAWCFMRFLRPCQKPFARVCARACIVTLFCACVGVRIRPYVHCFGNGVRWHGALLCCLLCGMYFVAQ